MKHTKKDSLYIAITWMMAALVLITGCKKEEYEEAPEEYATSVTGVLKPDPTYSLFLSALSKAELTRALNDAGPFTVFAPNNTAFQAAGITNQTIDTSNTVVGKTMLLSMMTYHFIGGQSFDPSTVKDSDSAATAFGNANGTRFFITNNAKGTFINGVRISKVSAITAANGVIHTIEKALTVPTKNIVEALLADSVNYSILIKAVRETNLAGDLAKIDVAYSLLAPTNTAFTNAGISYASIDALAKEKKDNQKIIDEAKAQQAIYAADTAKYTKDPVIKADLIAKLAALQTKIDNAQAKINTAQASLDTLKNTLLYHVTPRVYFAGNLNSGDVRTLLGKTKTVKFNAASTVTVTDAKGNTASVTQADKLATNGVIHTIDKVLMP